MISKLLYLRKSLVVKATPRKEKAYNNLVLSSSQAETRSKSDLFPGNFTLKYKVRLLITEFMRFCQDL